MIIPHFPYISAHYDAKPAMRIGDRGPKPLREGSKSCGVGNGDGESGPDGLRNTVVAKEMVHGFKRGMAKKTGRRGGYIHLVKFVGCG